MTKNDAIQKVLDIALAEVGYLEKTNGNNLYSKTANAGHNNYTKYGYEMHSLYPDTMDYPAPWCDCFFDWCFVKAFGFDMAMRLLHRLDDYTVNSATYYKQNGEWYKSPQIGDQIFFNNSKGGICHTGIVCDISKGYVYTIEGNTSSTEGVEANGGAVAKKRYALTYGRIAGYGRPNYSLISSEEDLSMSQYNELKGLIENLKRENEELKAVIESTFIYNWVDDNMPDWAKPAVTAAIKCGAIKGDEEGKLNLSYKDLRTIVREYRVGLYDSTAVH